MKKSLSNRIKELPASATLEMSAKARELKNSGIDIIGLSVGEPDFGTPSFIKDSAIDAVNQGYNSYTPVDGYSELKESIIFKFKRDNNLVYEKNQIVVSTGAKQSIYNVIQVLINPGDDVIIFSPYWVSYSAMVTLAGGNPIDLKSDISSDFKVSPKQLEEVITPNTKLILLNSPNNPSGSIYSEKELKDLSNVICKYPNTYVMSDEIYEHIYYDNYKPFSFAGIDKMYGKTITVNGLSKAYAMTGWRVGYIGAPEWIAKACTKLQGQTTSGTNCIAQRAAITALKSPLSKIKYMIDEFNFRRNRILDLIKDIDGFKINKPKGAFYVFPDISNFFGKSFNGTEIKNATDFSLFLLEKANVATVTGDAFGCPNNIRISYAASLEKIEDALNRIKNVLN